MAYIGTLEDESVLYEVSWEQEHERWLSAKWRRWVHEQSGVLI